MAWWDKIGIVGGKVDKAAVILPAAGGDSNLFTVTGGRVLLTELLGQVTVLPTATGAVNCKLQHTPTTGAAAATDMCGALDVKGDIVDTIYTITGGVAVAMVDDAGAGVAVNSFMTNRQILQPGTISLNTVDVGGVGDVVGAIKWKVCYIPLDDGAAIVAA